MASKTERGFGKYLGLVLDMEATMPRKDQISFVVGLAWIHDNSSSGPAQNRIISNCNLPKM